MVDFTKIEIEGTEYPLLKINNVKVGKITTYKPNMPKLWSSKTGRDLEGNMKGSLKGLFTKIQIVTGKLTEDEFEEIATELNKASLTVEYYNPVNKHIMREIMYAGDLNVQLMSAKNKAIGGIEISLIAFKKFSYAVVVV